jgi:Protein kinase domain
MLQTRERALAELLTTLFDSSGLQRWVYQSLGSLVFDELPSPAASLRNLAFHTVRFICQYGLGDQNLFASLLRERPQQAELIHGVAQAWDVALEPAAHAPAAGASRSKPPPVPTDRTEHERKLGLLLQTAYLQREELVVAGKDTAEVERRILQLKRQLRHGPGLNQDDVLDGRFRLLGEIGRGGFASLWKAYDRKHQETVAIKVLHGQWTRDQSSRERFSRGARAMARLHHQSIVRIIELEGEHEGYPYFVMEYLEGGDFQTAVLNGRISPMQTLRIILEACSAIEHAHSRGCIHRDIKPANILLGRGGTIRVTDFDLALLQNSTGGTNTGAGLGTFLFAAPEQLASARQVDGRCDVYSLGMTAIFGLYGQALPVEVLREPELILSSLPCTDELKAVLMHAVEWKADKRYSSVGELREALHAAWQATWRQMIRAAPNPAHPVPIGIPPALMVELYREARRAYPTQCCGWLSGPATGTGLSRSGRARMPHLMPYTTGPSRRTTC